MKNAVKNAVKHAANAATVVAVVAAAVALVAWLRREGFAESTGKSTGKSAGKSAGKSTGKSAGKSAMVIVEPRRHPHLAYVLRNFDKHMPEHYELYVFHGASAGAYARRSAAGVLRRVRFEPLDVDNLTADGYNALLKSRAFWDRVDAENVLVFQTDTVLCSASRFKLADFEHLGYVGCAYDGVAGRGTHWGDDAYWGVGGLSFRKKSAMTRCIDKLAGQVPADMPEDVFFSECVDRGYGERPKDGTQLAQFCSQGTFAQRSWGAHRIADAMAKSDLPAFLEYCPEGRGLLQ